MGAWRKECTSLYSDNRSEVNDKVVDTYDTDYGFRYTELDTKTGIFFSIGEKGKI